MAKYLTTAEVWEILLNHHDNPKPAAYYMEKYNKSFTSINRVLKGKTYPEIQEQVRHYINTKGHSELENIINSNLRPGTIVDTAYYYYDEKNKLLTLSFGALKIIINNNNLVTITTNEFITGELIQYREVLKILREKNII